MPLPLEAPPELIGIDGLPRRLPSADQQPGRPLGLALGKPLPGQPSLPGKWGSARQVAAEHGAPFLLPRRCRYSSSLRLPLMYGHPYSQITVETEFDNPIYETGVSRSLPSLARPGSLPGGQPQPLTPRASLSLPQETREYEVSI